MFHGIDQIALDALGGNSKPLGDHDVSEALDFIEDKGVTLNFGQFIKQGRKPSNCRFPSITASGPGIGHDSVLRSKSVSAIL